MSHQLTLQITRGYLRYALTLLALANLINYMDRMIFSVVLEQIKHEFVLSDTQIGLLAGFAFAIFFATFGLVIARLADRYDRTRIIALSILVWSAVTALTGAAQNFWQLFLARIGVGVGEAGVSPAATALVADYFEPKRRAAALAILTAGSTSGMMVGLGLGGWMAERYGWRWAFIVAGIVGVPLSWVIGKTLREVPRGCSDGKIEAPGSPLSLVEALRVLLTRKTYVYLVVAGCMENCVAFGILQWMPAFVIRRFTLEVAHVGLFFGMSIGLGQAAGAVLGGTLADRLAQRDLRWLIRIPFVTSFLSVPIYEAAIFASSSTANFALICLINVIYGLGFGPILAVMQSVVPSTLRATGMAFYAFAGGLVGAGCGPFLVGMMSDALAPSMGKVQSLQLALGILVLLAIVVPYFFYRAMGSFAKDMGQPAEPLGSVN